MVAVRSPATVRDSLRYINIYKYLELTFLSRNRYILQLVMTRILPMTWFKREWTIYLFPTKHSTGWIISIHFLKFIIGGSIIVGVTFLAEHSRSPVRRHTCSGTDDHDPRIHLHVFRGGQADYPAVGHFDILVHDPYAPVPGGILFLNGAVQSSHESWRGVRDLDWGSDRHEPDYYRLVIGTSTIRAYVDQIINRSKKK